MNLNFAIVVSVPQGKGIPLVGDNDTVCRMLNELLLIHNENDKTMAGWVVRPLSEVIAC